MIADDDRDEVEALADEFVGRRRRGEHPSIEEYANRCPGRADEIRELFPAIAAMERWKPRASPRRPALRTGDRIGDYRIFREIGRGGMGIVFEAEKVSIGSRVAIKVMPDPSWGDDLPARRFRREAEVVGRLDHHPNIVTVFDVGEQDGLDYYVMPLIRGVGLDRLIDELSRRGEIPRWDDVLAVARALIERQTPVPPKPTVESDLTHATAGLGYWEGVARVTEQAARALQHAHDRHTLHRDIKPANLLMDASGSVMVTDFGLATRPDHADLTRTGDVVGTLRYIAPERFRGENDPRSDLYSLGLTLYELLTLRPAYQADDRIELVRMVTEARPTPPRDLVPAIPRDLETVVLKAIHPDLDRRYPIAAAMADDLARFRDGSPIHARRPGMFRGIRRWVATNRAGVAAMAGGWAVILTMVGSVLIYRYLYPPLPPPSDDPPPPFNDPPPPSDDPPPPINNGRPPGHPGRRPPPPWLRGDPPPPFADRPRPPFPRPR